MATPDPSAALAGAENAPGLTNPPAAFPPFDAHNFLPQIVWLAIIFGALYWLMSRVALPRVGGILEARSAKIGGDLAEATTMQEQAAAASAAYDAKLAEAKARAQGLAQETHDTLHAETEAKRHALDDELNRKLAEAEAQIADTKTRAMSNVEGIARDAAAAIVEHLTGKPVRGEAIDAAMTAVRPK
ncbi:MAG TPA: F0F1 ATP synthase subunit B' [Lichenihabitans sp.]|jgi:F-type H+-transporting ATPase subunit b|nr:F0F1 ATP synthase subunit B' [Lichenihabitans sp.]